MERANEDKGEDQVWLHAMNVCQNLLIQQLFRNAVTEFHLSLLKYIK